MIWVGNQTAFDSMIARISGAASIGIDTEADSLHSYFDKVCLIQITANGEDYVIDPLAKIDIAPIGRILGDRNVTKILHGGDYDVRILNRDFGFVISNLVDTMICAQLLGYEAFGLAALLERHFGVKADKTHQRADWAMRPLPPDMLAYAAMDTRYLERLAAELREQLTALGRWEWALEEFSRLEAIRYRETDEDVERWRRLKNIGGFDRRSLAVVRDLYNWRDQLARKADRPPFKVIGNDAIVDIARERPDSHSALGRIRTLSKHHYGRYGDDLLRIVKGAMQIPEAELPERAEGKAWIRDRELEARVDRMKKVRDRVAKELAIDASVLSPRHVLTTIASLNPENVDALTAVPAMREWQRRLIGEEILRAMRGER
jgi:ribonuclease D